MTDPKAVEFRGSVLDDLRAFPASVRRDADHQLDRLQYGLEADDWKPIRGLTARQEVTTIPEGKRLKGSECRFPFEN